MMQHTDVIEPAFPSAALPVPTALSPPHSDSRLLVIGASAFVLLAACSRTPTSRAPWDASYATQLALLLAGLVFTVGGLGGAPGSVVSRERWTNAERGLVLGLTALALAVRAWRLDLLRLLVDEGNSVGHLFSIWRPSGLGLAQAPSQYVNTLLYPYWQQQIIDAFGYDLSGLRLASAILGAATIPAVYLLTRSLFDRSTAVLAAVLLVAFPPHVHFSRVALPHITDALFGTLAFAWVVRAVIYNRRVHWALAGAALGLTHYGFEAGRLFYTPLLLLYLALLGILLPKDRRARFRGAIVLASAFALTVLPVYYGALASQAEIFPRWRQGRIGDPVSWTGLVAVAQRIGSAAQVYVWQPDQTRFYGGVHALVLPFLAPLFLIGFWGLALARAPTPALLAPLWIAAAVVGNAMLRDFAAYARWIVVFPAIAVCIAVGLRAVVTFALRRRWPTWSAPLAIGLGTLAALLQVTYYFGSHVDVLTVQALQAKPYRDATDAVLRAIEVTPRQTQILLVSDPVIDVHPVRELLELVDRKNPRPLAAALPYEVKPKLDSIPRDYGLALGVEPGDAATVELVGTRFRLSGPLHNPYPMPADKEFLLYVAPPPKP